MSKDENQNDSGEATEIVPVASTVQVVADEVVESANDASFDMDDDLEFLSEEPVKQDDDADDTPAEEAAVDMANILDDKVKVNKGVMVKYRGKTEVLLARMNNAGYQSLLSKLYIANKHAIDAKGPEADKLATACTLQAVAKKVVLGWNHMELAGDVVPYSPKAALFLLKNSEDFKKFVEQNATKNELYFKQSTQEDKETLKKLLLGN